MVDDLEIRAQAAVALHPQLKESWLWGLANNKAAPASVVRRILAVRDRPELDYVMLWLTQVEYAAPVLAELAGHPDFEVRRSVAENPATGADALAGLADDPEYRVRLVALVMANDRGLTLPAEIVARLAADARERIRIEAQTQQERLLAASRADLAESAEPDGSVDSPENPGMPDQTPSEPPAPTPRLSEAEAVSLITSPDPGVRADAAWDAGIPRDLALRLADDPDDTVRLRLSLREDLSDDERQAIPYIVPDGYHQAPPWIQKRGADPEALIRLASSPHVLIRRSVARFSRLPAAALALLVEDEDFFVKLTLCQSCADTPHELLIEMWAWWHGKTWWFIQFHPNFDRPGFAKYSTHANDRLRVLALRDPELSVDEVVRLASDRKVWGAALADPRMPMPDLEAALLDSGRGSAAARNPRLPQAVMHMLLDLAAVPQDPHPPFSG